MKYPSSEKLSCDSYTDDECEFGVGFLGENYGEFDWVGDKCYEHLADSEVKGTAASSQVTSTSEIRHRTSTVSCKQFLPISGFVLDKNFPAKRFKICHILYLQKPRVALSIFHFVLLYFFPNACPGLRGHQPSRGHSLREKIK